MKPERENNTRCEADSDLWSAAEETNLLPSEANMRHLKHKTNETHLDTVTTVSRCDPLTEAPAAQANEDSP